MSYCRKEGKDTIIFATKENHQQPSTVQLPPPERPPGLILPDGTINWSCPCLGGMSTGPCGVDFREAFSCFHYSKAEPKGSDCVDAFRTMTECMQKYPTLYGNDDDVDMYPDEDEDFEPLEASRDASAVVVEKPKRTEPNSK